MTFLEVRREQVVFIMEVDLQLLAPADIVINIITDFEVLFLPLLVQPGDNLMRCGIYAKIHDLLIEV